MSVCDEEKFTLGVFRFQDSVSVFDNEYLKSVFQTEAIPKYLSQGWAIQELESGSSREELVEDIWAEYEKWAQDYLEDEKDEYYL